MEAEDPLSQLRDIHLPDPVSFWPPAPGWWILLLCVLIGLAFLARHAIVAMIRRRRLESVMHELDQAYVRFTEQSAFENTRNQAGLDFLATVNVLLKRVAQVMYPDSTSSRLTGRDWLHFLDACDQGSAFSQGPGSVLADGAYKPAFNADGNALYQAASTWIENRYKAPLQQKHIAGAKA